MKNVPFDHIKQEIGFETTLLTVRNIWYSVAEGYIEPKSPHYKEQVTQLINQSNLTSGWQFRIMDHGDIDFQFHHPDESITVQIYKNRFGKEMIHSFVENK